MTSTIEKEKGGLLFSSSANNNLKLFYLFFSLIFLLTLTSRIYKIDQKNLWFDEIYSWNISTQSSVEIIESTSGDIHPPLYYLVLKLWNDIFGDGIIAMRMLSVFLSILSFIFIFFLAKFFFEDQIYILLTLLLYAVSPLNIYYSQEVRMQSLNLFLNLGSVYFFFLMFREKKILYGILFTVFTFLALYTHYFSFLILFTEIILLIYLLLAKKIDRSFFLKILFFVGLAVILFSPWIPVMLEQISKGQPWRIPLNSFQVAIGVLDFFKDIFLSYYIYYESSGEILMSTFFSLLMIFLIFYSLLRIINKKPRGTENVILIFSFFLLPLIIAVVVLSSHEIILSRYLSITLPYLFIGIVLVLFAAYKKITSYILFGMIFLSSIYGLSLNYENKFKNNDYRKIISFIEENYYSGDELIVDPHYMGWSIKYYAKHEDTKIHEPNILGWNLNEQLDSLRNRNDLNNLWMILDYNSLNKAGYEALQSRMNELGYERKMQKFFYILPEKVRVEYYSKN